MPPPLPFKLIAGYNFQSEVTAAHILESAGGADRLTDPNLIHLKSLSPLAKVHGVKVQLEAPQTVDLALEEGPSPTPTQGFL